MWLEECSSFMNSCYQLSCTIARRPGQYQRLMCNADYATKSQRASRMCYQGALLWRRISNSNVPKARNDAALKILFFEILRDLGLLEEVPPWHPPVEPKPIYESRDAQAFWDIPVYAVQTEVRVNRVDFRIINHKAKKVTTLEISCPWMENRTRKDAEKTLLYGPMRWELKKQFKGYVVEQHIKISL